MSRARNTLIAVDGPDGAGKSTQVALLRDWLTEQGVPCEVVGKWDVFDPQRHPESRFLRGTDREDLRVCVSEMAAPARAMFIMWMYADTTAHAERLADTRLVILDGFWMKHAAAELAYGTDPRLVEAMTAALPAVDAVFYLDVEPAEALRRKQGQLTPYECGLDPARDPTRFVAGQVAIRDTLRTWAQRDGWHLVAAGSMVETQAKLQAAVWATVASGTMLHE